MLDVGCAAGNFGRTLKASGRATTVTGIEIDKYAAKDAAGKLDEVICTNLNQVQVDEVLKAYRKNYFDYIVCADVLEHLIDPWEIIEALTEYLKPDGKIVVSIPNVRHWSVVSQLIFRGLWEYQKAGIMDKTHLRFFTQRSALDLIRNANLRIISNKQLIGGKSCLLNRMSFGLMGEFLAVQFVMVGQKCINNKI